jgi:ribose 5-phosphate isomerase A
MGDVILEDPTLAGVARRALEFVGNNSVVGLGSGRAATAFVRALGARVAEGLRVRGVPTSDATAAVARDCGIPLVGLEEADTIDVTVDGADEVDPQLDLIKGYGGALVREKIVAAASRVRVILVGEEKLVPVLGSRGIVPVEVIPFAEAFCRRRLAALGCRPRLRVGKGVPFRSDGGNSILDCEVEPLAEPGRLDDAIRAIPGVVGTGLFLGVADRVLVGTRDGVREMRRDA